MTLDHLFGLKLESPPCSYKVKANEMGFKNIILEGYTLNVINSISKFVFLCESYDKNQVLFPNFLVDYKYVWIAFAAVISLCFCVSPVHCSQKP